MTRVATMMIASTIGRWRTRLVCRSTKSAVAPPTSVVVPGGGCSSRIRFTVVWLASETKGWLEIDLERGHVPARAAAAG